MPPLAIDQAVTAPARSRSQPVDGDSRVSERRPAALDPLLIAFAAGAVVARVAFWITTNRMFDDGLTTITHARNVPLGLGLIHHPGEGPVHGFTSALGVLVPLVGELIHEGSGMLTMRIASLAAVCVALGYARFLCRDLNIGAFPTAFVLAYFAFDQNMIFFGMSGMETQVAVAILVAGIYYVRRAEFVPAGICLGLAPLVRPEFVLWMAPAFVYLVVINRRRALLAAGISAAVIAPWVAFTTLYYGSPIPNTIIAKSTANPIPSLFSAEWSSWFANQLTGHTVVLIYHLQPFREVWSTTATPIPSPVLVAVAIAVLYFFVLGLVASRRRRDLWPAIAFLGLFLAYRIYFLPAVNYYEWYLPPFLGVVMIVVAVGMQQMSVSLPVPPKAAAVVLSIAFAMHMPFSFAVDRQVQSVDDQVRTNVALYLKANVQPGQSVVSESAGYIGFYGDVKLYDYPGLTSKTSVRALQSLPPNERDIPHLIAAVNPDWLVLRPWELQQFRAEFPDVAARYEVSKVFEMPGVPESVLDTGGGEIGFAGYEVHDIDMKFTVLQRTPGQ